MYIRGDAAFDPHFSSKRHFKELRASVKFLEHPLIIGRGQVRNCNLEFRCFSSFDPHAFPFNLAADSVNTASTLFNRCRIPAKIMVEYMPTLTMKVDPFLSDRSGDEDFWPVRRVESEE